MLRGERDWTRGKGRVDNDRTKKLYEVLEEMTCEIERVQNNCAGPKANRYLRKSATDVLRKSGSRPSLQEEAEIARGAIFPDSKARTKSAVPRLRNDGETFDVARVRFDEATESVTDKPRRGLSSSKYNAKKRSVRTNANEGIADDARSTVRTIASNTCDKERSILATDIAKFIDKQEKWQENDRKIRARIKSSIGEYLQRCCSGDTRKSRGIEEEERSRDVTPSANVIADVLASHNIGSHVWYENFEERSDGYDSDDYTSENDEDRSYSNTTLDAIREIRKTRSSTSCENTGLYNDTRSTKAIDARPFDTRRSSNVTNCQSNTFVQMGLSKKLSRDMLSQILQSEYLKKDLSL